jgi:NADH pyrophosphatase NudC (nudix superfamily)
MFRVNFLIPCRLHRNSTPRAQRKGPGAELHSREKERVRVLFGQSRALRTPTVMEKDAADACGPRHSRTEARRGYRWAPARGRRSRAPTAARHRSCRRETNLAPRAAPVALEARHPDNKI